MALEVLLVLGVADDGLCLENPPTENIVLQHYFCLFWRQQAGAQRFLE